MCVCVRDLKRASCCNCRRDTPRFSRGLPLRHIGRVASLQVTCLPSARLETREGRKLKITLAENCLARKLMTHKTRTKAHLIGRAGQSSSSAPARDESPLCVRFANQITVRAPCPPFWPSSSSSASSSAGHWGQTLWSAGQLCSAKFGSNAKASISVLYFHFCHWPRLALSRDGLQMQLSPCVAYEYRPRQLAL